MIRSGRVNLTRPAALKAAEGTMVWHTVTHAWHSLQTEFLSPDGDIVKRGAAGGSKEGTALTVNELMGDPLWCLHGSAKALQALTWTRI